MFDVKRAVRIIFNIRAGLVAFLACAMLLGCGMDSADHSGAPGSFEETLGEVQQKLGYSGHDYLFVVSRKTWAQAAESCASLGYGLVTINNSAEDEWLKSKLSSTENWWIGYNDRSAEGSWRWSTGTSTYVNWSPGEPNNWGGNEDCAVKISSGAYVGFWNDEDCGKQFAYVCESVDGSDNVRYFDYSASNTNSATQNTVDVKVNLQAGQTITVGTCGIVGASASGDTYLRLYGPNGQQAAYNDDACGSISSSFSYTVPAGSGGMYVIKAGCYSSGSCSGRVGYTSATALGRFARYCGKVNSHQPPGGNWTTDSDCTSGCNIGGLSYCKKFWPGSTGIRQVSVSSKPNNIWTNAGCAPVVDDWDGNDEFECIKDYAPADSATITYANVPITYEANGGILRFNSTADLNAVVNQLEADYETYNTNYESAYSNLTTEQMDAIDEQNNFDELAPFKDFELQFPGFVSKRSQIETIERNWLASELPSDDPDLFDFTFDDAENTLFNGNYEIKVGSTTYRMAENGMTDMSGAPLAAPQSACDLETKSGTAHIDRASVTAFGISCIANRRTWAPPFFVGDKKFKLKVAIHNTLIRASVKTKVIAYKKKSGGGYKNARAELAVSVEGTLYGAGCDGPSSVSKRKPFSGFKKRHQLKVREGEVGVIYRTRSGELFGHFGAPSHVGSVALQ